MLAHCWGTNGSGVGVSPSHSTKVLLGHQRVAIVFPGTFPWKVRLERPERYHLAHLCRCPRFYSWIRLLRGLEYIVCPPFCLSTFPEHRVHFLIPPRPRTRTGIIQLYWDLRIEPNEFSQDHLVQLEVISRIFARGPLFSRYYAVLRARANLTPTSCSSTRWI